LRKLEATAIENPSNDTQEYVAYHSTTSGLLESGSQGRFPRVAAGAARKTVLLSGVGEPNLKRQPISAPMDNGKKPRFSSKIPHPAAARKPDQIES
jgi:hypothetical protein